MRDPVKVIELKKSILEDNDADAEVLRGTLKDEKLLYINIMSSPGSGKTTTLSAVINRLKDEMKIGVMEADIDSDVDAQTIAALGVKSIQLHTGGMCHLDAEMSRQGMREMGTEDLDVVFLENVGNLVCPAEFDTGAHAKAVILSVPEGDDKPLKYPLMFEEADVVLVTKIDAMEAFDFAPEKFRENLAGVNPDAPVFFLSGATGEGVAEWADWLREKVENYLT